uniref:Uncharacterized protein n=1 Tax=Romanomermis culicivorax TaxID=13658 RepID=A0A915KBR8_ROMCU
MRKLKNRSQNNTGSVYEIEAREFNCFVCDDLSHFKIVRKSFSKDKDWDDHSDDEKIHYKTAKSKFLMSTACGELEEILPLQQPNVSDATGTLSSSMTTSSNSAAFSTCGLVRWTETQPVFTTVFFNERGIQKCKTKTARMHVPLRALRLKKS